MLSEATLLSVEGLHSFSTSTNEIRPSLNRGHRSGPRGPATICGAAHLADPRGTPGGVYQVPRVLGASIVNANQMSGQPLALALALGVAALVSLSAAVAASVRRRLKKGASSKLSASSKLQLRGIVVWQTLTLLLVAVVVGLPLGIYGERWRGTDHRRPPDLTCRGAGGLGGRRGAPHGAAEVLLPGGQHGIVAPLRVIAARNIKNVQDEGKAPPRCPIAFCRLGE